MLFRSQGTKILQALWCSPKNKSIIILKKEEEGDKTRKPVKAVTVEDRLNVYRKSYVIYKRLLFERVYVVLEKTLESPLDRKKIKPVIPKGNQF